MSALDLLALLALPLCVAVLAYLLGFDNGYRSVRRELRKSRARRAPRRDGPR